MYVSQKNIKGTGLSRQIRVPGLDIYRVAPASFKVKFHHLKLYKMKAHVNILALLAALGAAAPTISTNISITVNSIAEVSGPEVQKAVGEAFERAENVTGVKPVLSMELPGGLIP